MEFPADPGFAVLSLNVESVLGSVRVFGDGHVVVHKYSKAEGWQNFELQLVPAEMQEILQLMGDNGVFEFDHAVVRAKLRDAGKGFPQISHSSSTTLEMRLARYRGGESRVASDFSHRAWISGSGFVLKRAAYYREVPELVALAEVNRRLLLLSQRSDLKLIEPVDQNPSVPPSWASAAVSLESTPRILFLTGRPAEVWTMDWLGGDRRRLAILEGDIYSVDAPYFSPERSAITYRTRGSLQLVDLSTGARRKFLEQDKGSHSAVWSPVADEIAMSADIGEHRYFAFSARSDGSNLRRLTAVGAKPLQWSNDGEKLYYSAPGPGRRREVYVVSRDGTDPRRALQVSGRDLRIAPDGRYGAFWIADESEGESASAWVWTTRLNRSRGTQSQWPAPTRVAEGASGFDWSPDSKYLALTSGRRLSVIGRDGRELKTLVHLDVGDRAPSQAKWSPDGDVIVFVQRTSAMTRRGGGSEIWVVGKDGSDPRRIASGVYPHWVGESMRPD